MVSEICISCTIRYEGVLGMLIRPFKWAAYAIVHTVMIDLRNVLFYHLQSQAILSNLRATLKKAMI